MDIIVTASPSALSARVRGLVPQRQLPALVRFITEYASAEVIDEAELDRLVQRFVDDEGE